MTGYDDTRAALQRVGAHVAARRRFEVSGRFGLRATPGGFGTPLFGPDDALEAVRVDGGLFVHEVGGDVRATPLDGASLRSLAEEVGVELTADFSVGHDTPELGDVDAPLAIEGIHAEALGAWLDLGWRALDRVAATGGAATVQLWPEHFDAGTNVPVGAGPDDRCNLGASTGDGFHPAPYLYVGPWSADRPGDAAFWNAPFGAVLGHDRVTSVDDALAFFERGLGLLRAG
jgi:hypothetical protein